jgi:peptide/nickel transport system substrate-binding protein
MTGLALALLVNGVGAQTSRMLRVGLTQEPGTLNPIVGTLAIENDVVSFLFSGLTRYDERGNRTPDLATRVPTRANGDISADGRTITYHLVRNARWSDGVPLTSADVKFTYEQIVNPRNNVANLDPYDKIARVETPDAYTVRLILDHPYAPALDAFSDRNQGAIVPEHLLRGASDLNHSPFASAPIGSGPYTLVAWRRGSEIELAANPTYFRAQPKIQRVVIRILPNDNTMTIALRAGELDLADNVNISTYLSLGKVPNLEPVIVPKSFWEHLTFNTERAPVDDVRVRRALCQAFDVRELFTKVAHGLGALGPTSESPVTPWFNRKLSYPPYDPKAAAQLLDEAGWRLGPDGKRSKNGKPLEITLISTAGNVTREQIEVILQQKWSALGIDVNVKNLPPATIFAPIASGGIFYGGNFDVALSALIDNTPDPNRMNVNTIDHIPPHGNNLSRYRNEEITQLEERAARTFVESERKRLYDRIQEIELRDLPYFVLRWQALIDFRSTALQGVKPAPSTSTFWNVADWTLR